MQPLTNHPVPVNAAVRIRPGKRNSLRQLLQVQQVAFRSILALEEDLVRSEDVALRARTGSSIAQLARSWDALEDRKRILRGRPLPGSLKPEKEKPKRIPYWHAVPLEEPEPTEPPAKAREAEYEMRDLLGFPGAHVMVKVDSSPAVSPSATRPEPPADDPCPSCGGRGKRHDSNFGVDLECGACNGTGHLTDLVSP